jgi:hypothetical protein
VLCDSVVNSPESLTTEAQRIHGDTKTGEFLSDL